MLRIAIGVVLVVAGTVWILQGLNVAFAPQSFMTGDRTWSWSGAVAVVVGAVSFGGVFGRNVAARGSEPWGASRESVISPPG